MVDFTTWQLVGVSGAAAAVIIIVIVIIYKCVPRGSKRDEESYGLLLEKGKGAVLPRVNPDIDRQQRLETALLNARFYVRSRNFVLDRFLPDIGHPPPKADPPAEPHKLYFLVTQNRFEFLLAMTKKPEKYPIPFISETARNTFVNIVKSLEHPYISMPVDVDYVLDKEMSIAVRPIFPKGSLKDFIHKAKPTQRYADKYNNDYALNPKLIGKFGRQILEALSYLKFQGVPFYHLHAGNVLVSEDNNCSLSDFENHLVGVTPLLAPFLKPLVDKVEPEVVCFGNILYEMAFGCELESVESFSLGLPASAAALSGGQADDIKKVLEAIFNPWFGVPPTVDELLKMNLFADVKLKKINYTKIQFNNREKEMLANANKVALAQITESPINASDFQKSRKSKKTTFEQFSDPNATIPPLTASMSSSNLASATFAPASNAAAAAAAKPAAQPAAQPAPQAAAAKPAAQPAPQAPATPRIPPPPSAPKPPPPPPPSAAGAPPPPPPSGAKSGLFDSITNFKGGLKKTKTVDKSGPKLRST